jgi:hypothetical protein
VTTPSARALVTLRCPLSTVVAFRL